MTVNQYVDALNKARQELDDLLIQRAEMDGRISQLEVTINGLAALCDPTDYYQGTPHPPLDASAGITDAIRMVLNQSHTAMTAPQIRDALLDMGYDTSRYASILTVIHNTIKRMNDQGEIFIVQNSGRFVGWRYRTAPPPPGDNDLPNPFGRTLGEMLKEPQTPLERFKQAHKAKTAGEQLRDLNAIRERHKQK